MCVTSLLLIPGLLNDEALWDHQIRALGGALDISVPVCSGDDTIAAMAARVLEAAPDRFVLCGLSMGGYVATEIMRRAPERVKGLILCDTSARPDTEEQTARRRDFMRLAQTGRFKGVTPRLLPSLVAASSLEKPEVTGPILEMAERMGREVYIRQQSAIMGRPDSRPGLRDISCPSLVIVGREDRLTPIPLAQEMSSLIPGASLAVVEEAGHLPPLEQPQAFTELIKVFLKGNGFL